MGRRIAHCGKLAARGIHTAAQLCDAQPADILTAFGVTIARVQRELQGRPCIALEEIEPDRKQIIASRSFGSRVEDHAAVAQALATFAVRACEKLRRRGLVAGGVGIFANSDVFRAELPQHHPSRTVNLPRPTDDSRVVLATLRALLRGFLRAGVPYKKAGVMLHDLGRTERLQGDLFGGATLGDPALMRVVDRINERYGRGAAGFGATGWNEKPAWGMRHQTLSPCYTTRFADLPTAGC